METPDLRSARKRPARPAARGKGASPAASPGFAARWYRSAILRILGRMTEGRLLLTLPDGSVHRFGGGDDGGEAAVIRVRRERFFRRCVLSGDIGFGESYVDGDWHTDDLQAVIAWFLRNIARSPLISGGGASGAGLNLLGRVNRLRHLLRDNTVRGSRRNILEHYDLGNEFFAAFLDPSLTYSSAIFDGPADGLERAQAAKYDRLCRELRIGPDSRVLEIGSGWGGFAVHAASTYRCRVTAVTISGEQAGLARRRVAAAGLGDLVEVQLRDYRSVQGTYDAVVSIEMLEAVGDRHLESFFAACHRVLAPLGALGLQVIVCPDSRYDRLRTGVDWIQKHVFPGSLLPSVGRIVRAVGATGDLSLRDLRDFGKDYARTLRAWSGRFHGNLDRIRGMGFDEPFLRTWSYYLAYCEAAFRMRNISVQQMIWVRPNNTRF